MACHIMDMSYSALDRGAPVSVEAVCADGAGAKTDISPPTWATITYVFPPVDDKPAVKYVWYDGYKDAVFDPEAGNWSANTTPPNRRKSGICPTKKSWRARAPIKRAITAAW